jgi:RNA polymerase sigma-70 factor, ECF subfamily
MSSLAHRLSEGDRRAFAELYDACADRLFHYLLVLTASPEDAADVLQETFVRLGRLRQNFRRVANPETYAFVVARNEARRLGTRLRRQRLRQQEAGPSLFQECADDDRRLRENAEAVRAALASLDPVLREVVELKAYGGLTLGEIGMVTNTPPGTVATRYRAALAKLRNWLTPEM